MENCKEMALLSWIVVNLDQEQYVSSTAHSKGMRWDGGNSLGKRSPFQTVAGQDIGKCSQEENMRINTEQENCRAARLDE